jgi:GAF domain-containing protein
VGNTRGDRAIALVKERKSLFVPDLDSDPPEDWEGSGSDYRTFISASIFAGERAYGMLTVDAPAADDLGENDVYLVLVLADLLAIAFAEAERP